MNAKRIVSLLPSATEIVSILGGEVALRGRSHECDYPLGVTNLPICTNARISSAVSSEEIDTDVKQLLANALSIYEVDVDQLEAISPDLIVTQDQCEVCAVSRSEVEQALSTRLAQSTRIVSLTANDLAGVWADIERTAEAMDVAALGKIVVGSLRARLENLKQQTGGFVARPKVACIEWTSPMMVAGNWVPELVAAAGGENVLAGVGSHSPYVEWAALLAAAPDVIVAMPCGFDMARTRIEMAPLTGAPEWSRLPAVQAGAVYITDGNQYFNRPGPRLVESAEILAEILHPGAFDFGHQGIGWEKL